MCGSFVSLLLCFVFCLFDLRVGFFVCLLVCVGLFVYVRGCLFCLFCFVLSCTVTYVFDLCCFDVACLFVCNVGVVCLCANLFVALLFCCFVVLLCVCLFVCLFVRVYVCLCLCLVVCLLVCLCVCGFA